MQKQNSLFLILQRYETIVNRFLENNRIFFAAFGGLTSERQPDIIQAWGRALSPDGARLGYSL